MWTTVHFLTNPDGFSPLAPVLIGHLHPLPHYCHFGQWHPLDTEPFRPFMLSTLLLKYVPICSLLSVPTATKQVLGTFHLDSGDSPLARLPASSHSALPCAS